ncbi:MAG: polyprenyl synthetase family protein [Planctomycetes bacterium]|nr:polyprenyl synthetase family protein [Planctomycetota bacterium]
MQGFVLKQQEKKILLDIYSVIEKDLDAVEKFYKNAISADADFEALKHLSAYGGKKIRAALLILLLRGGGYDISDEDLRSASVIELIHAATLLHDDVLDDTLLRRQGASFKAVYDNEKSIITGDYLLSRALSIACGLKDSNKIADVVRACELVCLGEMNQLENRNNFDMAQDTYLDIIKKKTATLFELAAVWACRDTEKLKSYAEFGNTMGTLFQIVDDWLDIMGDEGMTGKSTCQDIKKGKMTLPLILLRSKIGIQRIEELFRRSFDSDGFQGQMRGIIGEYKIDVEMESFLKDINTKAIKSLADIGISEKYQVSLGKLIEFLGKRKI